MVKVVQDFYFKKAKKEGYPARSVYKLEEAQRRFGLLSKGDKVLDLGCHPGSWSMYSAKVVGPQGLVVGADIQRRKGPLRVKGAKVIITCADIYLAETVAELEDYSKRYNVLISDMAPKTTGNKLADHQRSLDLSRRALEIAALLLETGGNFYCKVFDGEDLKEFFESVRSRFNYAKIFKPKSSRKESREVFVLGKDFII